MNSGSALVARLTYAASLTVPVAVTVLRDPIPDRAVSILGWAILTALGLAALPRRLFAIFLGITWLALPATVWWCGYAVLNGIGPGLEAGRAALATSLFEAWDALSMVAGMRGFFPTAAAHACLLMLATYCWVKRKRDLDRKLLNVWLAAALVPMSTACAWQAADPEAPPLLTHVDALSSPVGSYAELALQGFNESLVDHFFPDPLIAELARTQRSKPREAVSIDRPMLSVMVMGESVRAGGLGPGNEARGPWSKALSERMGAGLGTWLPTTCASANGTLMSVPMFLTGTAPENYRRAGTAPSGLARLHAAGYRTALISNQGIGGGFWEDGHDYVWTAPQYGYPRYDEIMLPLLESFAANLTGSGAASAGPMAAVLHMMGSHFVYAERYPQHLFPAIDPGTPQNERNDLEYDRANEYAAKNLMALATFLDKVAVPAFAVYVSDHGDNLEKDHNGVIRHLGARTTQRDGFVSSLILWNRAMADTGRPRQILDALVSADLIAHRDVYRAWMALSGLDAGPLQPTRNPMIRAKINVGEGYRIASCSALRP